MYMVNDPIHLIDSTGLEVLSWGQKDLDVVSWVSGLSELADLLNAEIFVVREDYSGAALSRAVAGPIREHAYRGKDR